MKKNEYKPNLPTLKHIFTEMLQFRADNGITKALAKATELANMPYMSDVNSKWMRRDAKHLIAACEYPAAICRKELKRRNTDDKK